MGTRSARSMFSGRLLELASRYFGGRDDETDWLLESWRYTLDALPNKPEALLGGVDWISKRWLLETFIEAESSPGTIPGCKASTSNITTFRRNAGSSSACNRRNESANGTSLVRQQDTTRLPRRYPRQRSRPRRERL